MSAAGAMARRRSELDADGRRAQLLEAVQDKGVGVVLAALQEGATQLLDICREKGPAALLELVDAAEVARDVWAKRCKLAQGSIDSAREGQAALDSFALEASAALGEAFEQLDGGSRGGKREKAERAKVAEEIGVSTKKVSDLRKLAKLTDDERAGAAEALRGEGRRLTAKAVLSYAAAPSKAKGHASAEYYTPTAILRADAKGHGAKRHDVDATSCLIAQAKSVQARKWYSLRNPNDADEVAKAKAAGCTAAQIKKAQASWQGLGGVTEGKKHERLLTQVLGGIVWIQPDYGDPGPSIRSALQGFREKRIKGFSALLNCATSSDAQQQLLRASSAVLFVGKGKDHPRSRIAFEQPDGVARDSNDRDQVIYYVGAGPLVWAMAMAGFGTVLIIDEALHEAAPRAEPPEVKPAKAPKKRAKS